MSGVKKDCQHRGGVHKHGTRGGYMRDGCRCFPCRIENSRIDAQGRAGGGYADDGVLIPRCGTLRRLQALHAVGWSQSDLAAELGVTKQAINDLSNHETDVILAATADKIAGLYDRLWDQQPPNRYRQRTINWARRRGFVPPLAYDDDSIDDPSYQPAVPESDTALDEVAVQRIIDGTLHIGRNSRSLERIEAIRRLAASGNEDAAIGQRIGMARDAVQRARLRAGIPAGVASNRKKAA